MADIANTASDTALLLVNLGTPTAPTPRAVRRYLGEFLQRPPRGAAAALAVVAAAARRDPAAARARVARKYAEIWLPGGSPLAVLHARPGRSRAVAPAAACRSRMRCAMANRRWQRRWRNCARRRPARAGAAAVSAVFDHDHGRRSPTCWRATAAMPTRMIEDYHVDPGWVAAVAASIRAHWQAQRPRRTPAVVVPRHAAAPGRRRRSVCAAMRGQRRRDRRARSGSHDDEWT